LYSCTLKENRENKYPEIVPQYGYLAVSAVLGRMLCVLVFFSTPRGWKQGSFISLWPAVLCPHAFEINSDSWSLKFFCTFSTSLMSLMFSDCWYFMIRMAAPHMLQALEDTVVCGTAAWKSVQWCW